MLRPEPLPRSPSSATITTGRPLLLDQARGDDADHPGVPALAGEHVGIALAQLGDLRFGLEADAPLDLAPLAVRRIQLACDLTARGRRPR